MRRDVNVGLESLDTGPLHGKGGIEEYDADVRDDQVQLCVPIARSPVVHSPTELSWLREYWALRFGESVLSVTAVHNPECVSSP